jgi:hypothetical protein
MNESAGKQDRPVLSFVIPVFNEGEIFREQLASIRRYVPGELSIELIVVDNYSTDNSFEVARESGVDVLLQARGTVASLRNEGARHARGTFLVFLDADVCLTGEWQENILPALAELDKSPHTVSGSWVCVPSPGTWIENIWFARMERVFHSHINTGHLLMLRSSFAELGGFDESLASGEDYEFSTRAKENGYVLNDDSRLRVIHHGYPKTTWQFFRREVWHGEGDCLTLAAFLGSPIAIAGQVSLLGCIIGISCALILKCFVCGIPGFIPATIVATGAALTRWRPTNLVEFPAIMLLSFVYFIARGISLYSVLWKRLKSVYRTD